MNLMYTSIVPEIVFPAILASYLKQQLQCFDSLES